MRPRMPVRSAHGWTATFLMLGWLCALLSAAPVGATNYAVTVTTTADGIHSPGCATTGTGTCSLRDAILFANTKAGTDSTTITLLTNLTPYKLTLTGAGEDNAATGDLDIKANVTINGGGASATIIDGNAADRVFQVFPGYTVALNDVTIQNGALASGNGGGIAMPTAAPAAAVTLTRCVVTNNHITGTGDVGGGISGTGTLTLNSTTVSNNSAANLGGGIAIVGTLVMSGSTVQNNTAVGGGGLYSFKGFVTISNSTFTTNHAVGLAGTTAGSTGGDAHGGAIHAGTIGTIGSFSVTGSSFTGNTAAGGMGAPGADGAPPFPVARAGRHRAGHSSVPTASCR
jgi:CSLREA domain-containing protein